MAEVHGRLTGEPAGLPRHARARAPPTSSPAWPTPTWTARRCSSSPGRGRRPGSTRSRHQVMDVVGMYEPITKWAQSVLHARNIPEIVRKAVRIAKTEKPGRLPDRAARGRRRPRRRRPSRSSPTASAGRCPDDKVVDQAWAADPGRERPIILAGNGTIRRRASRAAAPVRRADRHRRGQHVHGQGLRRHGRRGLPVHHRPAGPKDHPVRAIERVRRRASPSATTWSSTTPGCGTRDGDKRIVHIDFLPAEVDERLRRRTSRCVGDLAHTLWMLNERCWRDGSPAVRPGTTATPGRPRARCSRTSPPTPTTTPTGTIRPQKALWDARQVLGPRRRAAVRRRRPQDVGRPATTSATSPTPA